jgi:diguanylate cyclase (GGDEF)-like protein
MQLSNRAFDRLMHGGRFTASHAVILAETATFLLDTADQHAFAIEEPGAGGRHFQVHLARLPAMAFDPERAMITLVDRTVEVQAERSLRAEMSHDSLTGLPNRLAFIDAIDAEIAAGGSGFAVLAIDLIRFSRVNECIGAMAGDELIITVARRLMSALRAGDMLARMAGDEFGVLIRRVDGPDGAEQAARRLQGALSSPIKLAELDIRIDCAIGCALWDERSPSAVELMRNAQVALKRAKLSHRAEIYRYGEVTAARRRFSLETELRRAIDAGQLKLAFQPLIDFESGGVSGFEALARWDHPDEGPIQPSEFIAVAEESGLIVPLGRWALDSALRTLAGWETALGETLPLKIAVNVSPVQLTRDSVADAVEQTLRATGMSGDRLTLELTESAIVGDPERAKRVLDALQSLDCRIAMDDFGTGYSSLSYLQKLPIDILKIDQSFVGAMLEDRDSIAIVRAILGLADALGMETTAEGVEDVETARMLAALGCTTGQGYHFSMPLPPEKALAFYQECQANRQAAKRR